MSFLAIAFAVLAIDPSASALGLVLACGTVSMLLFLLAGGVFADRLSRRNVMVAADLVRAASQGTTAVLLIAGTAEVWHLAALQLASGAASAFFLPAAQGLIPDTVSAARLQQANVLLAMSRSAAGIGGPALAGVLVETVGPGWAIALDAATFLGSAALLSRLRVARADRGRASFLTELREGWAEFARRTWVWASVANFGLFQLIVLSSWLVLGPYVADTELGGAGAWATVLVAGSVGALLGGAVALRWRPARPLVAVFGLLALWAPQFGLLAIAAPVPAIAAAAVVGQAAMSSLNAIWFTALQERIPAQARSRVSSYDWIGSMLFLPIGMALVGPISSSIGVTPTLLAVSGWTVAASLFMLLLSSIRSLRRDEPAPSGEARTAVAS